MGARVVHMPARRSGQSLARRIADLDAMLASAPALPPRRPAIPVYVIERPNRCPDCHGEAFLVGRVTAECARCWMPMPIVNLRRVS